MEAKARAYSCYVCGTRFYKYDKCRWHMLSHWKTEYCHMTPFEQRLMEIEVGKGIQALDANGTTYNEFIEKSEYIQFTHNHIPSWEIERRKIRVNHTLLNFHTNLLKKDILSDRAQLNKEVHIQINRELSVARSQINILLGRHKILLKRDMTKKIVLLKKDCHLQISKEISDIKFQLKKMEKNNPETNNSIEKGYVKLQNQIILSHSCIECSQSLRDLKAFAVDRYSLEYKWKCLLCTIGMCNETCYINHLYMHFSKAQKISANKHISSSGMRYTICETSLDSKDDNEKHIGLNNDKQLEELDDDDKVKVGDIYGTEYSVKQELDDVEAKYCDILGNMHSVKQEELDNDIEIKEEDIIGIMPLVKNEESINI